MDTEEPKQAQGGSMETEGLGQIQEGRIEDSMDVEKPQLARQESMDFEQPQQANQYTMDVKRPQPVACFPCHTMSKFRYPQRRRRHLDRLQSENLDLQGLEPETERLRKENEECVKTRIQRWALPNNGSSRTKAKRDSQCIP